MSTSSSFELRTDQNGSSRWLDLSEGGRSSLTIDQQELQDIRIVSEVARPGKPKLDKILHDEVERSKGSLAVACALKLNIHRPNLHILLQVVDPRR